MKLSASILSADFAQLGEHVRRAEAAGVDSIHVDVMDGRFVPNLTIGPLVVDAVRQCTSLPLDVHLMVVEPERLIRDFAAAGASILTVHQEACVHLQRTLTAIRELGVQPGVSVCPSTPVQLLEEVADDFEVLLIMTVNPGFAGQKLIPATVEKIRRARALLERWGASAEIEVDGGINAGTAASVVVAGATTLVAGSAVFGDGAIEGNVQRLREASLGVGVS